MTYPRKEYTQFIETNKKAYKIKNNENDNRIEVIGPCQGHNQIK